VILRQLTLADFRNFAGPPSGPVVVEFGPRFTVLWGHNGAGKTNILEGLYLISTLRSFRTADLGALLRRGCDRARLEVEAFDEELGSTTRLEVRLDRTARSARRSARLDGKLVRSAADFYGRVQAVLFTPEDLGILRGSPSGRRQFLDRVVFARERAHIGDVQAYDKLLRSRNRVLKLEADELPTVERRRLLDTYDHGLAEVGARLWARRVALIDELREPFARAFAQIHADERLHSGSYEAGLRYASRLEAGVVASPSVASPSAGGFEPKRARLSEALAAARSRDEAARRTTVGPHLDDLELTLDGSSAGEFASQGQSRALILAFKIAELRAARERSGRAPLLLLDDVSSELDPVRSARLFEALGAEVGQCVLTTTAAHHIALGGSGSGSDWGLDRRDIEVRDGVVRRA
jgi:DNA replication and repair protein RecF